MPSASFSSLVLAFIDDLDSSSSTSRTYANALGLLAIELERAGAAPSTLLAAGVSDALTTVKANRRLSDATMQVHWGAARAFLRWAHANGHLPDMADQVHPPVAGARLPVPPLPCEDIARAVERASFSWSPDRYRDRAAALLFLHAGLEVQEALALTWEDVDGVSGVLRIRGSRRERLVPVRPQLGVALARLLEASGGYGRIFRNVHGEPISARGLQSLISELGRHVGYPELTARTLRSVWTQREVAAGRPLGQVAELGGFASTNAVQKRMGVLGAETAVCEACDGEPDLGPPDARCVVCLGTGATVWAPPLYVQSVRRPNAVQRVRAWSTEVRRLGPRLAEVGFIDPSSTRMLDSLGARLWRAAEAVSQERGRALPPVGEDAPGGAALVEVTQRLRALGTDLRKLAAAMERRQWVGAELARDLQRDGAYLTLLAVSLEEGERSRRPAR